MKNKIQLHILFAVFITISSYAKILINEIHYNPLGVSENSEFIELWNNSNQSIDISGWTVSDGVNYSFPAATFIPANEFVVITHNPVMFITEHPTVKFVYGPFEADTKLSNGGERIALSDSEGTVINETTYSDSYPWPETADGGGASLELKHPAMDLNESYSWSASFLTGGTPGSTNSVFVKESLIFNTVRFPRSPISISNVFLTTEFIVGTPTNVIVKYSSNQAWRYISLSPAIDGVWTSSLPAQTDGVWVDYIIYAINSNGVTYGNSPELMQTYCVIDKPISKRSVIINEIMYNSSTSANHSSYEYVELFNTSSKTVDLAGCIFEDIRFSTNKFLLPPKKFAVITDRADVMNSVYGEIENLININIGISDNGETLRFKTPNEITISKVIYDSTNDWPIQPNGFGPSLELRNPYLDPLEVENWDVSSGFGTPGLQNSNYSTGSFGSLTSIKLSPSSPDIGDEVYISVEALSSTNITSLIVDYKTNDTQLLSVTMYDDGTHNDSLAGDGVYSAIIPPIYNPTYVWYRFRMTLADSSIIEFDKEVNFTECQLTVRLSGDGLITEVIPAKEWQISVTTGTATSSRLYLYLDNKNEILVDNISIKDLTGTEYIVNGTFNSNDFGWLKTGNHSNSIFHIFSGYFSPCCERIIAQNAGGSDDNSLNCYTSPSLKTDETKYILSFAYRNNSTEWYNYYNGERDFNNLYINEIMARNNSTITDNDGNFSDWIELYNAGTNSIPLGNLYLTDNLADKDKWQIPIGMTIDPGDYIVFLADGEDIDTHTNFKFDSDGESAGIFSSDKELIDSVVFGSQLADISFGRRYDGSNAWVYFSKPTPNAANDKESTESLTRTPAPDFSISGGFYTGSKSIELSVTSVSANIRFTLNGSSPATNFFDYNAPINITTTTVVRAYSIEENYIPSLIVTHTYFINESNSLPVVSVSTTPSLLWDDQTGIYKNDITDVEIPVNIEFYEPDGTKGFSMDSGMQIGGWNIFRYAQNPLNIYARNKYEYDFIEYQIFNNKYISQFKKIVLRNGGDDWHGAMFRDAMMQSLAIGRMSNAVMSYRPCVVFLNGEYWGIHNIREKYDEQYFIANFGLKAGEFDHIKYDLNTKEPAAEQGDLSYYNKMADFISNNDMSISDNYEYINTLMDINSFIDRTIMAVFTADTSWHHNDELWRQRSETGKWEWVIVDLDRGFNINNVSDNLLQDVMNRDEIFKRLIQNNEFKNDFITRFAAHLNTTFDNNRVNQIINNFKIGIQQEIPRHITRWSDEDGISSINSWENDIEELIDFQSNRHDYVFQHIRSQFGLNATAKLYLSVSKPGGGKIFVNNVSVPDNSFSGDFFLDIPININFVPAVGYDFSHWEEHQIDGTTNIISSTNDFLYNFVNSIFISAVVSQTDDLILSSNIFENLVLSETGMPYFAQGDIIVHSNTTLKINAGVNIQMPESSSFYVYGNLEIHGNKISPVVISSYNIHNSNKWGAVCFVDATETSVLSHVRLEGATRGVHPLKHIAAISAYNSSIVLDNVEISADYPVSAQYGDTIIRNSILRSEVTCDLIHITHGNALIENCDLGINNAMDTDAIDFDNVYNGVIVSNKIHDLLGVNSDGIDIGESSSNITIFRNVIYNCSDKGVSVGQQSSADLKYNVIRNCSHGIGVKDSGSFVSLDRNTFYGNTISVACYEKNKGAGGGRAKVINSILSLSHAASFMTDNVSSIEFSYSLSDRDYLPGLSNLFSSPLFFNPDSFNLTLSSDSPCIDAGDPLSFPDTDGTRADMGAYYYYIPEPCLFIIYQLLFFVCYLKYSAL